MWTPAFNTINGAKNECSAVVGTGRDLSLQHDSTSKIRGSHPLGMQIFLKKDRSFKSEDLNAICCSSPDERKIIDKRSECPF